VTRSRFRSLLIVVGSASIVLGACGLPADSAPRVIAADKVPFGLLGPSTTNPGNEVGGEDVKLYFVNGERLRAVTRQVTDTSPQMVLDALVRGPADTDPSTLKGAIPPETKVLHADQLGDTLTVVLTKDILSVTGPLQKTAFAQLVYTATGLPGVNQVRFRVADADGSNEQDVEPPTDTGTKQGALTQDDYRLLQP
jgi:hypothetical protein